MLLLADSPFSHDPAAMAVDHLTELQRGNLQGVKNNCGSVDGCIRNGLDITAELREKLQNRFLEY